MCYGVCVMVMVGWGVVYGDVYICFVFVNELVEWLCMFGDKVCFVLDDV